MEKNDLTQPQNRYGLLIKMLEEYEQQRQIDSLYNLIDFGLTPNYLIQEVLEKIRGIWGSEELSTLNVEFQAVDWWEKHKESLESEELRFLHLHYLLESLNDFHSEKARKRIFTSQGTLILGRSWWEKVSEEIEESKYAMVKSPPRYFAQKPFPNIRFSKLSKDEWIRNDYFIRHFSQSVVDQTKLNIGLVSLDGKAKTLFRGTRIIHVENGEYGFVSEGVASEQGKESIDEELRNCINWANENKVHILAFPELSISPLGVEVILGALNKLKGTTLSLVFPGSFHKKIEGEGAYENQAPILLNNGQCFSEISFYSKTERFTRHVPVRKGSQEKGNAEEDDALQEAVGSKKIKNSLLALDEVARAKQCEFLTEDIRRNSSMRVLSTPLGYIGVEIRKDNLSPFGDAPGRSKTYPMIDHLFVLAMNASDKAWFNGNAESLGSSYGFSTFFVNATQIIPKESYDQTVLQFWWYPVHMPQGKNIGKVFIPESETESQSGRTLISIPVPKSLQDDLLV